jgi:predicted nucleic acid-binding protein
VAIVVLDASVIIAFLDAGDAHHAAASAAVRQARREALVLPSSAYAEVLVDPWRRGPEAGRGCQAIRG